MNITVHTDGASRGNPGPSSVAFTIGGLKSEPIEYYQTIGLFSNNQAEYRALIAALELLVREKVANSEVHFYSDSELLIKQMLGEYRVKDAKLRTVFDTAKQLSRSLEAEQNQLTFSAVRREQNRRADQLANRALDEQQ